MATIRPLLPPAEAVKRYESNRCAWAYCERDPARPCSKTCRYAQTEALLQQSTREHSTREAPPPEQDDPLSTARGVIHGILMMAAVAAVCLIAYGIGRTLFILTQ